MGCHFLLQGMKVKVKLLSHVGLLATAWTVAHQDPPSMGFSGQEYWSRVSVEKISWKRELLPTRVFLPGEFQGQRSLVGYSPWGHKESTEQKTYTDMDKTDN